jgi:RimJ/RimL family protein N-acetyltransferase
VTIPLTTERLDLISASPELIGAVLTGRYADAEAMLGAGIPVGWPTDAQARAGLAIHLTALQRDRGQEPWRVRFIVLRHERRTMGTVSLKGSPGPDGSVDLGWELEPPERGQGFATEAATAVSKWALGQPGVRRVTARIHGDDAPSVRVAERLGMRRTLERHPEHGLIWEIVRGV